MAVLNYRVKITAAACLLTFAPMAGNAQTWGDLFKGVQKVTKAAGNRPATQPAPQPEGNGNTPGSGSGAMGNCVTGGAVTAAGVWLLNRMQGKKVKATDVAAGAVVGCAAGLIFSNMNHNDAQALAARENAAVDAPTPQNISWTAPESQQVVQLQTTAPMDMEHQIPVSYDQGIQAPAAGFKVEAKTYVVNTARLNMRSAPTVADGNIVGYFEKGEHVQVIGRTPDGQWAILGDDGVVVGYSAFTIGNGALLVTEAEAASIAGAEARAARAKAHRAQQARNVTAAPADAGMTAALAHPKMTTDASAVGTIRVAAGRAVTTTTVVAATQCKGLMATRGTDTLNGTSCMGGNGHFSL